MPIQLSKAERARRGSAAACEGSAGRRAGRPAQHVMLGLQMHVAGDNRLITGGSAPTAEGAGARVRPAAGSLCGRSRAGCVGVAICAARVGHQGSFTLSLPLPLDPIRPRGRCRKTLTVPPSLSLHLPSHGTYSRATDHVHCAAAGKALLVTPLLVVPPIDCVP